MTHTDEHECSSLIKVSSSLYYIFLSNQGLILCVCKRTLRSEKEDYHVVVAAAKKRALLLRMHRKINKNAVFDQSELLLCDPLTSAV